ncbi:putative HTH transcriptional regulator [Catalinimonas alkaloidigena]|uniref:Piwi domain-containing protein n=1 Tax=Catalinimonas TaxID=1522128 RepID=UPI002404A069|nr:Piwi domain-containing protein [Catalinimonas alkaloidigena]MDF9799096.1 putative HTH transcriptional regulator [Catalinimonas alkaloidigena]
MSNNYLPKEVYDNPGRYWDFLTVSDDRSFEGQHFDRKEVCRAGSNGQVSRGDLKNFRNSQIAETISAFANENKEGGLLVLGIASDGSVPGLNHLSEEQVNSLCSIDYLVGHNYQAKVHKQTVVGNDVEIVLIYTSCSVNTICATVGQSRKAFRRGGIQNLELNDQDVERLKREKGIVDYENTNCSRFSEDEVDQGVYREFVKGFLSNTSYEWATIDCLKRAGGIDITGEWFTNAGKLFFSQFPGNSIAHAYIRLLRFDSSYEERDNRPTPTYDKKFKGPLTKQIRDFRTFISESAFFETYQKRKEGGGFTDEPEYPLIAIDEAVVNAVAHRDYAITRPIQCEKYTDAFVVINPGNIIQDHSVPDHFSLDDTRLQHYSRNPKIMEWLGQMKDVQGRAFVLALQEGTRRMREETAKLGLPAPEYKTTAVETTLVLRNNASLRKDVPNLNAAEGYPEYTNLYRLTGFSDNIEENRQRRREILSTFKNKLAANGWFIDKDRYGLLVAHRKGLSNPAPDKVSEIVRLFPAYSFQIRQYFGKQYLIVDYTVELQSVINLATCLECFSTQVLNGYSLRCMANLQGWSKGKITTVESEYSEVFVFNTDLVEKIPNSKIIPRLPLALIEKVLERKNVRYDLTKEIKKASLMQGRDASRLRAERTQNLVDDLLRNIFPLSFSNQAISLASTPLLISSRGDGLHQLKADSLKEPQVEFSRHHAEADIRQGITAFGSYENNPKDVEIIPLCSRALTSQMEDLISRLRNGKFKFKGSERTFGTKFLYSTIINADQEHLEKEVKRLLEQHPNWYGNTNLPRIFLVHCPNEGYAKDDENSPYYKVKRILFEAGIPCQMISSATLSNPDFKDLNLALNIVAKCGQTPWVLPESIPDCDFFVGLSYTQSSRAQNSRLMAFANVFNQYGRWEFYSGGSDAFSFEEKAKHYDQLVKTTLARLDLSEEPTVCFHYSAKFSKEDRKVILQAARSIRPRGNYVFVWINTDHKLRFYDSRAETNGSLARGRYVVGSSNQIYLSTSGHNPYRNALGTPKALEINVYSEDANGRVIEPDMRIFASHVLSLTKLNWASTDSWCAEPITTKYAGNIAYLTAAFLRQGGNFKLHSALERTPWFI